MVRPPQPPSRGQEYKDSIIEFITSNFSEEIPYTKGVIFRDKIVIRLLKNLKNLEVRLGRLGINYKELEED